MDSLQVLIWLIQEYPVKAKSLTVYSQSHMLEIVNISANVIAVPEQSFQVRT